MLFGFQHDKHQKKCSGCDKYSGKNDPRPNHVDKYLNVTNFSDDGDVAGVTNVIGQSGGDVVHGY